MSALSHSFPIPAYRGSLITGIAAVEAIQTACKAEDWSSADDFVRIVSDDPRADRRTQPELAILIDRVRARDFGAAETPTVTPVVVPEVEPILVTPIAAEEAAPDPTGDAEPPRKPRVLVTLP